MLPDRLVADLSRGAVESLSALHKMDILMTDLDPSNLAKVGIIHLVAPITSSLY
jgi:hypothetical protein